MKYIIRWTNQPFETVSFAQDSLALYIIAFLLLGKENYPLPKIDITTLNEKEKSIRLLSEICYLQNRTDIIEEKRLLIKDLANLFFNLENRYLLDTVWQFNFVCCQRSYYNDVDFKPVNDIENTYKSEIVLACRKALENLDWQVPIFHFKNDNIELNQNAIQILGRQGTILDIELLKTFTSDLKYGKYAVEAIKNISERSF